MDPLTIILIGVGVFLLLIFIVIYNGLVGKKNAVENAFSGIDVQLKKRHDLIPNLVSSVKAYMKHEKETLENLTGLRAQAMQAPPGSGERIRLEDQITEKLSGIMVQVEDYPELKASENVLQLQRSLNEVEAQLSASRRTFNATVNAFNNAIEMIPSSIVASMLGYTRKEYFQVEEAERKSPDVDGMFNS